MSACLHDNRLYRCARSAIRNFTTTINRAEYLQKKDGSRERNSPSPSLKIFRATIQAINPTPPPNGRHTQMPLGDTANQRHRDTRATCNGFWTGLASPAPPTHQHQLARQDNRRTDSACCYPAYCFPTYLLTQPQSLNDAEVTRVVLVIQITQKSRTPTNQLQQPATRCKVLLVRLEVLGQLHDAAGQQRHLNLW